MFLYCLFLCQCLFVHCMYVLYVMCFYNDQSVNQSMNQSHLETLARCNNNGFILISLPWVNFIAVGFRLVLLVGSKLVTDWPFQGRICSRRVWAGPPAVTGWSSRLYAGDFHTSMHIFNQTYVVTPINAALAVSRELAGHVLSVKLAFHDADTDTDTDILARILADTSDPRFPWSNSRGKLNGRTTSRHSRDDPRDDVGEDVGVGVRVGAVGC